MSTQLPTAGNTAEENSTALKQLLVNVLQRDTLTMLSFTDPWGSAVAVGAKKIETRSWAAPRRYWRCPVGIHVSGTLPQEAKMLCDEAPFRQVLEAAGYSWDLRQRFIWNLPLKHVIAIAWLEEVVPITSDFQVDQRERIFGNYAVSRYAWKFGAIYRLKQSVQATGRLGLWPWTPPESLWDEVQATLDTLR
jgi:hypothetical protein